MAFDGLDLAPVWNKLVQRVTAQPGDAAALLDLSTIAQLQGRPRDRRELLSAALKLQRVYRRPAAVAAARPLRLLAFMAPGDFMANTPIEFLLEGSSVRLDILYVSPGEPLPAFILEHDVAFVAIAESEEHRALFEEMRTIASNWPVPVVNPPALIERLTRDGAYALLHDVPGLLMPANSRVSRMQLHAIAMGGKEISTVLPQYEFPII